MNNMQLCSLGALQSAVLTFGVGSSFILYFGALSQIPGVGVGESMEYSFGSYYEKPELSLHDQIIFSSETLSGNLFLDD